MTAPLMIRFEAEFAVRLGPRMEDYRLMSPGDVIEMTDRLRVFNTSSGVCLFDITPFVQARDFGKVICRVGHFPETFDPHPERWYEPLGIPRFAGVDTSLQVTSTTFMAYSHPNDRMDRWLP